MYHALVDEPIPARPGEPVSVTCPYCFQPVTIVLDPASRGTLVRDCEVCCNPWELTVEARPDATLTLRVARLQ